MRSFSDKKLFLLEKRKIKDILSLIQLLYFKGVSKVIMKSDKLVNFTEWRKVPEEQVDATLKSLAAHGVEYIVAHPLWGKNLAADKNYIRNMAGRLRNAGLKAPACHAYWGPEYDLFVENEEIRKKRMEEHRIFLKELTELEVRTYTIHLGLPEDMEDEHFCYDQIRRSVDDLLPCCEECSIILAMENGNDSLQRLQKLSDLAESYDSPFAGFCFDTGHAHCYTKDWRGALEILRSRIATCHMHDSYGDFDDHNPPGEGTLPWEELIRELKGCPFMEHAETESGNYGKDSWERFHAEWFRA